MKPFRLEKRGLKTSNGEVGPWEGDVGWGVWVFRWRRKSHRQMMGARSANAVMMIM